MERKQSTIRALNDQFRQNFSRGQAFITSGVAALGPEAVAKILQAIAIFDDFCHTNDPYGEHDFGAFQAEGDTIMFKIDYYNLTLDAGSPDPADASATSRVITIMLASEY